MHYVQMRASVAPVVAGLSKAAAGSRAAVPPATSLSAAEAAVRQFDSWAAGASVPPTLAAALASMVSANETLLTQLATMSPGRQIDVGEHSPTGAALLAWSRARSALDRYLGLAH